MAKRDRKSKKVKDTLRALVRRLTNAKAAPKLQEFLENTYLKPSKGPPIHKYNVAIQKLRRILKSSGTKQYTQRMFDSMALVENDEDIADVDEDEVEAPNEPVRLEPLSAVMEFWQIDKRTKALHKYEIGVTSRAALEFLSKNADKLALGDDEAMRVATLALQDKSSNNNSSQGADVIRDWILNNTFDTDNDHAVFTDFLKLLKLDDHKGWQILSDFAGSGSMLCLQIREQGTDGIPLELETIRFRRLRDAAVERYLASSHIVYDVAHDANSFSSLLRQPKTWPYPDLQASCMAQVIVSRVPGVAMNDVCKQVFGKEWDGHHDLELTVQQASDFLERKGIVLELYNLRDELIFRSAENGLTFKSTLRLIYHNEHVFECDNIKSFIAKVSSSSSTANALMPNNLPKLATVQQTPTSSTSVFAFDEAGVVEAILKSDQEHVSRINILFGHDLNDLARNLLRSGFTPHMAVQNGATVTSMTLPGIRLPKSERVVTVRIASVCTVAGDNGTSSLLSLSECQEFSKMEQRFESIIMNNGTISRFNPSVERIFNSPASIRVLVGRIIDVDDKERTEALDFTKFYAACLRDAPFLPVISSFSEFRAIQSGDNIDFSSLLVVRVKSYHPVYTTSETLMYGNEYYAIKDKVSLEPVAKLYVVPVPNKTRNFIDTFFRDNPLDVRMKKAIVVKAIGKLGKRCNERRSSFTFKNINDALEFKCKHPGGSLVRFDNGTWIYNLSVRRRLVEHFRPIHEMVLGMARIKMFQLYERLITAGATVVGFKTDCVYVRNTPTDLVGLHDDAVGSLKYISSAKPPCNRMKRSCVFVDPVCYHEPIPPERIMLTATQEFDNEFVNECIKPRTLVLGAAGTGKSRAAIHYALHVHGPGGVLVVTAWNEQALRAKQHYPNVTAITLHKLLGMGVDNSHNFGRPYDLNGVRCIIFDEIFLHTHRSLMLIKQFVEEHAIPVLATGDEKQLESIGDCVDNTHKLKLLTSGTLFTRLMWLRVNKRIRADHLVRLQAFEEDLMVKKMSVDEVIRKHFPNQLVNNIPVGVKRAISFLNSSAFTINKMIHEFQRRGRPHPKMYWTLANGITYVPGDKLICKVQFNNGVRVYINHAYVLKGRNRQGMFRLVDILDSKADVFVDADQLIEKFSLSYCTTCHAMQGDRIDEDYIISDTALPVVTRQWLYSAVTRTGDMDKVFFLTEDLSEQNKMNECKMMVHGYKVQDVVRFGKGCLKDAEYITEDDINTMYRESGGQCRGCRAFMTFEKHSQTKATVDRIDNALPHIRTNCQLLCKLCNSTKR